MIRAFSLHLCVFFRFSLFFNSLFLFGASFLIMQKEGRNILKYQKSTISRRLSTYWSSNDNKSRSQIQSQIQNQHQNQNGFQFQNETINIDKPINSRFLLLSNLFIQTIILFSQRFPNKINYTLSKCKFCILIKRMTNTIKMQRK